MSFPFFNRRSDSPIGRQFRQARHLTPLGIWLLSKLPHVWFPHSGGFEVMLIGARYDGTLGSHNIFIRKVLW